MALEATIQVNDSDRKALEAALKVASIEYEDGGRSDNFDGHAIVDVMIKFAPLSIPVLKALLEAWLKKRKRFRLSVGKVVVEANSEKDLARAVAALSGKKS